MKKQTTIKTTMIIATIVAGLATSVAMAKTPLQLSDSDGDGVISVLEITEAHEARKSEALTQFDTDGNGELSREERRSMKDARHDSMLTEYDADGDGELSKDEKRSAKEAHRTSVETMLDVNGDGELSTEETAGFEQYKAENGDRKGSKRDGEKRTS